MLGSIDSNTGDPLLGWDTDQFPMNLKQTTQCMQYVIAMGGLAPGGLNFDCKVRRESTDLEDMFIGHIGAMDAFARGLRIAAKMKEDGLLEKMVNDRYKTFEKNKLGRDIESGKATFEQCEKFAMKQGEPKQHSGK